MVLDKKQKQFVDQIIHGKGHIVLTGKAGTGKSTALIAAVSAARENQMNITVMAPTAMAASIHRDSGIESATIHHSLRWNPVKEPMHLKLLSLGASEMNWAEKPDQNNILIIDECSMIGLWLFEILARGLGSTERPFDGRRVVFVGDWAQLPPVNEDLTKQKNITKDILERFGPPDGCIFYHPFFKQNPPVSIVLEETHRANTEWFETLNALRDVDRPSSLQRLGICPKQHAENKDEDGVHMCFRRITAHQRNNEQLSRITGFPHTVLLRDGKSELKEGCDVIVTANRSHESYINGSRAVFSAIGKRGEVILDGHAEIKMLADGNWGAITTSRSDNLQEKHVIKGKNEAMFFLSQFESVLEPDAVKWLKQVLTSDVQAALFGSGAVQFRPYWPILPAYAMTVHKAQGSSLAKVIIEEDVFWRIAPPRLSYVALSRVSDGSDVSLSKGLSPMSAKVFPDKLYSTIVNRIERWKI